LLESPIHEHRFTGLLILMAQFEGGYQSTKRRIFGFYLNHTRCVNNWDLVDASAPLSSGSIWSSDHDGFYIVSPNHPGCGSDGSRWWRRRRDASDDGASGGSTVVQCALRKCKRSWKSKCNCERDCRKFHGRVLQCRPRW
jgi:hypothetical protein